MDYLIKTAPVILLISISISFFALLKIHFFIKSRGKNIPWSGMHMIRQFMEYYDLTKQENLKPLWLKVLLVSHLGGFFLVLLIMVWALTI